MITSVKGQKTRDLRAGEARWVDTGCLVGLAPTVHYEIKFTGGFTKALFGGEGLFFAQIRGSGRAYLQSLPLSRFADQLRAALGRQTGGNRGAGGSGLLGNRSSGDR